METKVPEVKPSVTQTPIIPIFIWVLLIALLGLGLRLYKIGDVPAGFFCDEASFAYNSYTILHNGVDEHGTSFPVFFKAFGEYKPPYMVYLGVPFIAAFGLTESAARAPAALCGFLTILVLYLIGKEIHSERLGLITAFVAAIQPWSFHYNRILFECSSLALFFCLSILFLLRIRRSTLAIVLFFIFAGLTAYSYSPAKLLSPLLLLLALCTQFKFLRRSLLRSTIGLACYLLILVPMILSLKTGTGLARVKALLPSRQEMLTTTYLENVASNYVLQFSPNFLFFEGELSRNDRHMREGNTPLLAGSLCFFLVGLGFLLKNFSKDNYPILTSWLLLYPIGAMFVGEPYTSRSFIGAPISCLVIALGIETISRLGFRLGTKQGMVTLSVSCVILIAGFGRYLNFYFDTYNRRSVSANGWQYGPKAIIQYYLSVKDLYDDLFISWDFNAPEIFLKFYDPENLCEGKCKVGDIMYPQIIDSYFRADRRQLFVATPNNILQSQLFKFFTVKERIYTPSGEIAFVIGELSPEWRTQVVLGEPPPFGF